MALKIVHIAGDGPKTTRKRKPSAKEILHRKAIESLAAVRIRNKERAKKKFAPEWERVNKLMEELDELRQRNAKN